MQTKKRAKPVKFGKAAREAEEKAVVVDEPKTEAEPASETPVVKETPEAEQPTVEAHQKGGDLVDKLSDVPFETDFGTPSGTTPQPTAQTPSAPAASSTPQPEPVQFSATATNPAETASAVEAPKTDAVQPVSAPIEVSNDASNAPIGRSNEPIPFNPHETVFNTAPEAVEKKKNPVLYFLIISFVAFVTGIAFMAGIYYAMPDKNFFAMPNVPALPGGAQPTATTAPSAPATATPVATVKNSDYTISVLNGSGIRGEAAKARAALEEDGFTVGTVGNADSSDVVKTQIVYKKTVSADAITKLKAVLGKTYSLEKETQLPTAATQATDIVVTIGKEAAK